MVQHALDRGYAVVAVCRARSVDKLRAFVGRITIVAGATDDRQAVGRDIADRDGVQVRMTELLVQPGLQWNIPGRIALRHDLENAQVRHWPSDAGLVGSSVRVIGRLWCIFRRDGAARGFSSRVLPAKARSGNGEDCAWYCQMNKPPQGFSVPCRVALRRKACTVARLGRARP